MRITKNEVVTRQVVEETLESITCNMCGETTDIPNGDNRRSMNAEKHANVHVDFGYGSQFKAEKWSLDFCENCFISLLHTLKVAPSGFLESKSYPASEQALFEAWKEEAE